MHGQTDLLRVLYDPVSYYRPWRRTVAGLSSVQRSGLNRHLVHHLSLPGYEAPAASQRWLVDRLVGTWEALPSAALLVACAKLRSAVVAERGYLSYPPVVHAFMRLGFHEQRSATVQATDMPSLLDWGGRYIQALTPLLPAWLGARLSLPFAGPAPAATAAIRKPRQPDLTCFLSALTYASNDTELVDRLRG